TQTGGIHLGGGFDTVYLGSDGETVYGGTGGALIVSGAGDDTINGGSSGATTISYAGAGAGVTVSLALQGAAQNTGGAGTDTLSNVQNLTGSAYADILTGDANNNVITGGGGADTLTGGLGADTFVITTAGGNVTITDFSDAQGDKVDLTSLTRYFSLAPLLATATQVGADTIIDLGGGNSLTLRNTVKTSLTASDFVFPTPATILVGNTTVTTDPSLDLTLTSAPLVQFTDPAGGTLINEGSLTLNNSSSSTLAAVTTSSQPEPAAVFENDGVFSVNSISGLGVSSATTHNYGTFSVSGGASGGVAARGDFVNYGTVTVQGAGYTLYGVQDQNTLFQNKAGATFQVSSSSGQAIGVSLLKGGQFTNDGALTVSATAAAWGLQLVTGSVTSTIVNTGTITVTGSASNGIEVDANSAATVSLENDGTITAQDAIFYSGPSAAHIVNTGTLNGAVVLGSGSNNVVNTGTINGSVTLGNGSNDVLDSHLGHVTGPVSLG